MTPRWLRVTGSLMAMVLAGLGAAFFLIVTTDTRRYLDLEDQLDPSGGALSYIPGARMATEEICDPDNPCTQAVVSDTATILKYGTQQEAAGAAARWGTDGYHSYWIAVRFEPGGLSEEERRQFVQGFDESNTTSPD